MPGFVKSPMDEAHWQKAKSVVANVSKTPEANFNSNHWAMTNSIFQKMKKNKDLSTSTSAIGAKGAPKSPYINY